MNSLTISRESISVGAGDHEVPRKRRKPGFTAPMLCKGVPRLPGLKDWFYEVKYDGYRAIAIKEGANVSLLSRSGQPLDYPEAREAMQRLMVRTAVIDCELVAFVHDKPSVDALTRPNRNRDVRLYAFDLLYLNGHDLMNESIERRKERLCTLSMDSALLFSPALDCELDFLIKQVKRLHLSGIIAKRRGSTYEPGERTGTWLKMDLNAGTEIYRRLHSSRKKPVMVDTSLTHRMSGQRLDSGRGTAAGRETLGPLSRASQ